MPRHALHGRRACSCIELAERVEGAEPFWRALRNGTTPQRVPGSAPALAEDYVRLTEEVLSRIAAIEMAGVA